MGEGCAAPKLCAVISPVTFAGPKLVLPGYSGMPESAPLWLIAGDDTVFEQPAMPRADTTTTTPTNPATVPLSTPAVPCRSPLMKPPLRLVSRFGASPNHRTVPTETIARLGVDGPIGAHRRWSRIRDHSRFTPSANPSRDERVAIEAHLEAANAAVASWPYRPGALAATDADRPPRHRVRSSTTSWRAWCHPPTTLPQGDQHHKGGR